jgi:hypothetical protein
MLESFLIIVFVILLLAIPIIQSLSNAVKQSKRVYADISSVSTTASTAISAIETAVNFTGGNAAELQSLVKRARRMLEQAAAILEGIRMDTHACVKPGTLSDNPTRAEVILPEVGAFGNGRMFGDALISESKLVLRNEPLRTLRQIRSALASILSEVAVGLSVPIVEEDGVRMDVESRVQTITSQSIIIDQEMVQLLMQLVIACEEQRTRFMTSRPALAAYQFQSNSVHSRNTLPAYEFGSEKVLAARPPQSQLGPLPMRRRTVSFSDQMMTESEMEANQPGRNAMLAIEGTQMFSQYVSNEEALRQQNASNNNDEAGDMTNTLGIFGQGATGGVQQGSYTYAANLDGNASTRYTNMQSRSANVFVTS